MEEELSTACRAAADALEILSNLRDGFTGNVIPRINSSTAVSVSQANSWERQVNDDELQANESAVQSSTSPATSSSIQAWLATLFQTVGSNRASRKNTSRRPAKSKRTIKSNKGRPSKTLVYKVLVVIPSPKISKVPTHTARRQLEKRELVCLLVGASGMLWTGQVSERCMYVTPIRLDLLLNTNQISCCKGKWYVRRFDPDTVENGHIYSSVKEEEVFIYWVYVNSFCGLR